MPPPKHVHPGRLVVTKPDLPEQPRGADAGPPAGCGHRTLSAGLDTDRCRCTCKINEHTTFT